MQLNKMLQIIAQDETNPYTLDQLMAAAIAPRDDLGKPLPLSEENQKVMAWLSPKLKELAATQVEA